jgi:hypothetical protein
MEFRIDLFLDVLDSTDPLIKDSSSFDVANTEIVEPAISDTTFMQSSTFVQVGTAGGSISTQDTLPEMSSTVDGDISVISIRRPSTKGSKSSKEHKCLECGNRSRLYMIHF